jgi:hypothetical protein
MLDILEKIYKQSADTKEILLFLQSALNHSMPEPGRALTLQVPSENGTNTPARLFRPSRHYLLEDFVSDTNSLPVGVFSSSKSNS